MRSKILSALGIKNSIFTMVFAFTTISILLISGTFLFNSAIGFGPGTLDQENLNNPGSAQSSSIGSNFGFELGQQYMQDASNLHSVDIFFHNPPGAVVKVTPVKVCIFQSLSLNFKTGVLLDCVTKNVTEGPAVTDIDPTAPGTQFVENFEFSPNISQTPGVTYVVNVEEDRIPANSDTQIFWLIGQAYNPGAAVPDEVGISNGAPITGFASDDLAFRTFSDVATPPPTVGGEMIPLDTTMVLVGGAQYTAAWMIPVIVAGIGFAIVIARKF